MPSLRFSWNFKNRVYCCRWWFYNFNIIEKS